MCHSPALPDGLCAPVVWNLTTPPAAYRQEGGEADDCRDGFGCFTHAPILPRDGQVLQSIHRTSPIDSGRATHVTENTVMGGTFLQIRPPDKAPMTCFQPACPHEK